MGKGGINRVHITQSDKDMAGTITARRSTILHCSVILINWKVESIGYMKWEKIDPTEVIAAKSSNIRMIPKPSLFYLLRDILYVVWNQMQEKLARTEKQA